MTFIKSCAANVEVEGTDVSAVTIHHLFELDSETFHTKLEFAKMSHKVQVLVGLEIKKEHTARDLNTSLDLPCFSVHQDVLLLDEYSMIDTDIFKGIMGCMSQADHTRRPEKHEADEFGSTNVILFGDLKTPEFHSEIK